MGNSVKTPSVLGVGNALVDVISVMENDKILDDFKLPKGSMTLVDANLSKQIYDAAYFKNREISTGGSVANTIRTLANLGGKGGYMGKIGKDKLGSIFREEFEKLHINTHLFYSENDTGRVMGLVSPDSERTMATYLGAAAELLPSDFNPDIFKPYDFFYMEGYLVQNHELIETGVRMAKQEGLKVAIDLASFNIVEANLSFLQHIIEKYVDIVFANEEEAKAFTGLEPELALVEISKMCETAVVKTGKEGSLLKQGAQSFKIASIEANALDTTGAGDSYAAGFFYGLSQGFALQKCGIIAAYISGKVVEVMGANLPAWQWAEVNDAIKKMRI